MRFHTIGTVVLVASFAFFLFGGPLAASTIWVSPTGNDADPGTSGAPLLHIQTALNLAQAGDEIVLRDGTYQQSLLQTVHNGTVGNPIVLRAENAGAAIVKPNAGQGIINIDKAYMTFSGITFDGAFTPVDLLRVRTTADHLRIDNVTVRNGARDGIDLGVNQDDGTKIGAGFDFLQDVTISNSTVHDLLWNDNGVRVDAHGIVAGGVRDFTIRDTQVYFVSGDAFQLQDGAWDDVLVDHVDFHNGPLLVATAGFAAGVNPGENAIDTKQDASISTRGTLTVLDSDFYGWDTTLIALPAALNLKERVDVLLDGNRIFNSDVGLRLRGRGDDSGAHVTAINNLIYGNRVGARYEDNINDLALLNNTFGETNSIFLQDGGGGGLGSGFSALNDLFEAAAKPAIASDPSNLAVSSASFVNAAGNDFHLVSTSPAVDVGVTLAQVPTDFAGLLRPQGAGFDVGAFELADDVVPPAPAAVPEPATETLLGAGMVLLLAAAWQQRRRRGRIA